MGGWCTEVVFESRCSINNLKMDISNWKVLTFRFFVVILVYGQRNERNGGESISFTGKCGI